MNIAYILNTYPQPSHSFIRRELRALEAGGARIVRLAMRRSDSDLVDPADRAEAARTEYVLDLGAPGLLREMLACALSAPRRFGRAFRLAWRMGRVSETGILRHLVYLAEAAAVARRCGRAGIDHMHAHFGTNATAVAFLAHELGGPGYSFTTHGPEEFDAPRALSLGVKLDHAAFAVAVSQFGRSQLARWAAFETWPRLHVVHCAIEPAHFTDPPPLPDGGPLRLVNIGRFVEQKGQMLLVEAMVRLRDTQPDLHLTLVGDGEMRPALEAAIMRYGLGEHITLTGWLDETGVRRELAAAHGLILPSFAEGLPMVVMEAMAMARPVIATYIAGIPELVRADSGWLVPAGDVDALAQAVADMAATGPARLTEMGQTARTRVLARHDAGHEAAKLADHFAHAITAHESDR